MEITVVPKVWYVLVKTVSNGNFSACVEAESEEAAREQAVKQVREKYVPQLAWAETEIQDPRPK